MSIAMEARIYELLGYMDTGTYVLPASRVERVSRILQELDSIDAQLAAMSFDGNAVKIEDIDIDQAQGIALLGRRGSLLLRQLARLTGLTLKYDLYSGRTLENNNGQITSLSVVSYW